MTPAHILRSAFDRVRQRFWGMLVPYVVGSLALAVLSAVTIPLGVAKLAASLQGALREPGESVPAAGAAVATGLAPTATPHLGVAALLGILLVLLLVFLASTLVAAATVRAAVFDEGLEQNYRGAFSSLLHQGSQAGIAFAPVIVPFIAMLILPGPALKFGSLFLFVMVALAFSVIAGIATVATSLGEREHLPRTAVVLLRGNLSLATMTLGMLVALAIPVGLVGMTGVGLLASVPFSLFVIAVLVELYLALGGSLDDQHSATEVVTGATAEAAPPGAGVDPVAAASVVAPQPGTVVDPAASQPGAVVDPATLQPGAVVDPAASQPAGAVVDPAASLAGTAVNQAVAEAGTQPSAPQPIAGPTLEGVVQPGVAAGEWLAVGAAGPVTLQVAWSEGPALVLHVSDQAQQWFEVAQPATVGEYVGFHAPAAGWYWVNVGAAGAAAQSYRIATWLPQASAVA